MNYSDLPRASFGPLPSQSNRAFRLKWAAAQSELDSLLLPQRIDIREELCGGIEGSIACISTSAGVPLNRFIGLSLALELVTDRGDVRTVCGIVTDAHEGESDGSLATYQLVIRDALSLMERRVNRRIFRQKSVPDIIRTLVAEWRQRSFTLASAFNLDLSKIDPAKYPPREQTLQFDESDAAFVRRLCRREGIGWFIRAGKPLPGNMGISAEPGHTLVLFDNAAKLVQSAVGTVPYRADATIGQRDAVTLLCVGRQLVAGSIKGASWDYKYGRMDSIQGPTRVDQGKAGNDLARLLSELRIDSPHIADSWDHYDRLGLARVMSHGSRAVRVQGASGLRNLIVGEWVEIDGFAEFDRQPPQDRRITITRLHHRGENNLPKDLNERAQTLFAASRWPFDIPPRSVDTQARPAAYDGSAPSRYENTFSGVPRGTPITPAYDPRIDLPRVYPVIGRVTTPDGEEVFIDQFARIRVLMEGLAPEDHEHAQKMGTSGTEMDSAAVRVMTVWAGANFGQTTPPRKGMEVLLDFVQGDPDKMFVAGVFHNGPNMPVTFSDTGSLPGNRYLSGTKTKEVKGRGHNQVRFDDTPGQISAQLASTHAASQVNIGYLTHPRSNGHGDDRGEGVEVRTDAAAALRAAQGILLTTYARSQAQGGQLDREELVELLGECTALFKSLGDYAGQHGGQATDAAGQDAVAAALKGWRADGSSGPAGSQALMAFGAQAGSVNVTPKTHVTYAGEHIDQVARQHVQLTSGQRLNLQAGHGIALFAQAEGVSAVANQGKVKLQSQADDTQIDSAKNIQLTAAGGKLAGAASDQVVFVTSGGAYLKLHGGDIELGCPGRFTVKSAGHTWGGPASMSTDMPTFDAGTTGRVPQLVRATDRGAVSGFRGEVHKASGERIDGQSGGDGKLPPLGSDQLEPLMVKFFKQKT